MRAVEELVRRKLWKRAPDDFRLKLTLMNSVHSRALIPYSNANRG